MLIIQRLVFTFLHIGIIRVTYLHYTYYFYNIFYLDSTLNTLHWHCFSLIRSIESIVNQTPKNDGNKFGENISIYV